MSSFGLRALAVGVVLTGCGTAPGSERTERVPFEGVTGGASECAQLWVETREALRRQGAPDGEARRAADIARGRCEHLASPPTAETQAWYACASHQELRNAPAPQDPSTVGVYFSCLTDVGTIDKPVYLRTRILDPPSNELLSRLKEAIGFYLAGPTSEERDLGYVSTLGSVSPESLDAIRVEGEAIIISFSSAGGQEIGELNTAAASRAFLAELRALVFEFPSIRSFELQLEGDCQAFGRLLELACHSEQRT